LLLGPVVDLPTGLRTPATRLDVARDAEHA
jgi:hypothetical protein